ncbi:hypothetical protein U1Q18_044140 [Sarracenia purpurea var. burkii]
MMASSGASGASSSGNWRQYLNLSSENEGDSAPEPSTDRTPGHLPQGGGAGAAPAEQPVVPEQPVDVLFPFRSKIRTNLGIFLSMGSSRSVYKPLYKNAQALLDLDSAPAEKLRELDLKIKELSLRHGLPLGPKDRLNLLLYELGIDSD